MTRRAGFVMVASATGVSAGDKHLRGVSAATSNKNSALLVIDLAHRNNTCSSIKMDKWRWYGLTRTAMTLNFGLRLFALGAEQQMSTAMPNTSHLDLRSWTDHDLVHVNISRLLDGERNRPGDRRRRDCHLVHLIIDLRFDLWICH